MDWRLLKWEGCKPPLLEERLEAVERELGVRFPDDYRQCVAQCQGGRPEPGAFEVNLRDGTTLTSCVGVLLSMEPDDPENVIEMTHTEGLPQGVVPISDDGGGDYVALRFRSKSLPPKVVYWFAEAQEVIELAPSFSQFLDLLRPSEPLPGSP
jgi:hypothetical protein